MIETIINEPLALPSNASPVTFEETDIRTRCASCNCNGWLDYSNGNPNFKIFGNGYTGYYDVEFSASEHPYGKYAVTMDSHITALVNGKIVDTFNHENRVMRCAWRIY